MQQLRKPAAYPWPVAEVAYEQTHISSVFLAGRYVLKLKRPVQFPFVDFRHHETRRQACHDEVELNRRLTDGVYLSVASLVGECDDLHVVPEEVPGAAEYATLMARLPADRMLDELLETGAAPDGLAVTLSDRLIPFHRQAASVCERDPTDGAARQLRVVLDNLDELQPFIDDPLPTGATSRVVEAMRRFAGEQTSLFAERVRQGWIRDGHGDLRCEHICMLDRPQIFDCVEFNADLRCADVASDLSFFLMDLTRKQAPADVVPGIVQAYRDAGLDLPMSLLRFYWIHRALVRAKVHCLQLTGAAQDKRQLSQAKAVDYLQLALGQCLTADPFILLVTGYSGTGKSTVAASLAAALQARRFSTDEVRRGMADDPRQMSAEWGKGMYTADWTERVYERVTALAGEQVARGAPAILDGTFLDPSRRSQVAQLAGNLGVTLAICEVRCEQSVVLRRLAARAARGDSTSAATAQTYADQRRTWPSPSTELPSGAVFVSVDTSADAPVDIDPVLSALETQAIVRTGISSDGPLLAG